VRDGEARLVSQVLPLFKRKSTAIEAFVPELYLHGLAQGDFDLALRGLLGGHASLSSSTVARLKEKGHTELARWQTRPLNDLEVVYLWVDGTYVKAGLEQDKAALLVALAALSDGRKVVLAVTPGHRESTASWAAVLRDLRERGLRAPRLIVGDGHLGIWSAVRHVYPEAAEQRCWNHRPLNVVDQLPKRQQSAAKALLCLIPYAPTRREAEQRRDQFLHWCQRHGYPDAARCLAADWDRLVVFYQFPQPHWQHLRTTNPRGIAVCRRSITHRCGEAISAGEECDSSYLEDALSGGTGLSPPEASGVDARRLSRRNVHGWHIGKQRGRRLISIYTLIDDTS
jgi:putative transposase